MNVKTPSVFRLHSLFAPSDALDHVVGIPFLNEPDKGLIDGFLNPLVGVVRPFSFWPVENKLVGLVGTMAVPSVHLVYDELSSALFRIAPEARSISTDYDRNAHFHSSMKVISTPTATPFFL